MENSILGLYIYIENNERKSIQGLNKNRDHRVIGGVTFLFIGFWLVVLILGKF